MKFRHHNTSKQKGENQMMTRDLKMIVMHEPDRTVTFKPTLLNQLVLAVIEHADPSQMLNGSIIAKYLRDYCEENSAAIDEAAEEILQRLYAFEETPPADASANDLRKIAEAYREHAKRLDDERRDRFEPHVGEGRASDETITGVPNDRCRRSRKERSSN